MCCSCPHAVTQSLSLSYLCRVSGSVSVSVSVSVCVYLCVCLSDSVWLCVFVTLYVCASVSCRCCGCNTPWDKYRGKKRCHACGVPLLICPQCIQQQVDKTAQCTLCQEDQQLGKKKFDKSQHKRDVQHSLTQTPLWRQQSGAAGASGGKPGSKKPTVDKKSCGVCHEVFKSRNALFKHINETGHHNRHAKK